MHLLKILKVYVNESYVEILPTLPAIVQPDMKQAHQQENRVHPARNATSERNKTPGNSLPSAAARVGNRKPPTGGSEVL